MATLILQSKSSGVQPRFRVWHGYNTPNNMDYYAVESPEEAGVLIAQLVQDDLANPDISNNVFGLEELEKDGYHEWYSEGNSSITELLDKES